MPSPRQSGQRAPHHVRPRRAGGSGGSGWGALASPGAQRHGPGVVKDRSVNSIAGNLGDGPDILVFRYSHSLDYRTGSSAAGSSRDDDLIIGGCAPNRDGAFDILTTTIHTGPGRDWDG